MIGALSEMDQALGERRRCPVSLLYRAIWSDRRDDGVTVAREALERWLDRKTAGSLSLPESGTVSAAQVVVPARGPRVPEQRYVGEVTVAHATDDGLVPEALSATLVELREDGTRWDTTLRSWTETGDGGTTSWLWVDVECVGPIDLGRLAIAAPVLAVDLVEQSIEPVHGGLRLSTAPTLVAGREAGETLAETITDTARDLPLVVFSVDDDAISRIPSSHTLGDITDTAARRLAGVAAIYVADADACWALTRSLGQEFAVWGGAFRTYLPNVDPAVPGNNFRHRYVLADRYIAYRDSAAITAGRALGPVSGTRRPPASYDLARSMLRRPQTDDWSEIADLLGKENDTLSARIVSLNQEISQNEDRYFEVVGDYEDAVQEREQLAAQLAAAQRQIRQQFELLQRNGIADDSWVSEQLDDEVPDEAESLSDAAAKAQLHLSDRLVLPDEALRDLNDLDSTVESKAWGQTSWRGLRALHAYAVDQAAGNNPGDFWHWCATSKHLLAWPATTKKLSMRESDTVENNSALRDARVLPVAAAVDGSGRIYMGAHLKIATGGGNLAPRIYFHWDPATAIVHVGFFGPHKYMPNTRT